MRSDDLYGLAYNTVKSDTNIYATHKCTKEDHDIAISYQMNNIYLENLQLLYPNEKLIDTQKVLRFFFNLIKLEMLFNELAFNYMIRLTYS